MQICSANNEKCILSYSSVNITDNSLIFLKVITSSLIIMSDTGKVILVTYKLMSATEATLKLISVTSKMILATKEDTAHFKSYRSHYKNDLSH